MPYFIWYLLGVLHVLEGVPFGVGRQLLSGSPLPDKFASCGENIRASPQGAVLMYKWNRIFSYVKIQCIMGYRNKCKHYYCSSPALQITCFLRKFTLSLYPCLLPLVIFGSKIDDSFGFPASNSSSCLYKNSTKQRLDIISAWQSTEIQKIKLTVIST